MTTAYTSLLGFALPVEGELDGTWGDVVNDSITQLVEDSVAGFATQSVTSADWTLSTSGSGATNQARMAILRPTGTPGTTRNILAPNSSKAYIIDNQSNGSVVIKGVTGPTTGITVAAGKQALVAWNGSDFVQVGATTGGSNTQVQFNSSGSLAGSANLTFDGTTLTAAGFSGPLNGSVGATTPSTAVVTQVNITAQGDLRLEDTSGGQYVALQAPATVGASYTLTMPDTDGDASQVLTTDGSGVLSWTTRAPLASPTFTGTVTLPANTIVNGFNEAITVTASAPSSTTDFDVISQSIQYYTSNTANDWTLNIRGNSGTSLDTLMATGQSITITFLATNDSTAYYNSAVTIDGNAITPKWQGGTAPSTGNASAVDIYTYAIVKTGSAAFTVFASQTQFA
jgi:hypothetical protein